MNFVDYIYFIFPADGRILDFFADFPYVFNLVVGSRVHFENVEISGISQGFTNLALPARRTVHGRQTIYSARKNLRRRRFTRSPRAAKQICVTYSARENLIG